MKGKQIAGIIVVCLILIVTGLVGVGTAVYKSKIKRESDKKTMDTLNDLLSSQEKEIQLPEKEFVGQIDIVGTIQRQDSSPGSVASNSEYRHDYYLEFIDKMEKADNNKGIFLYVDSPGGTVYESDEMYLKLLEYKEKTGRPVYAYFAGEACSGAYYISMAADKIYANRNCWTGSIGVIISIMNYEKLMKKIGVAEIDITSGKNKTIGSGAHEMTKEQEKILQALVDEAYDQFTGIVAKGRNMDIEKVKKLADGRIYSAAQAKKYGLIDEIMGKEETKSEFAEKLGNDQIGFFVPKKSTQWQNIFDQIFSLAGRFGSKSDIQAARELMENDESGVLMYYAK